MMEHYELTYIVSIKYLEDELQKVMKEVNALINEQNGAITSDNILGRLKLAYPIKNTTQGTYVVVEFDMDGANIIKLDNQLKQKGVILRHLLVKKKVKTEEEIKREESIKEKMLKEKESELAEQEKVATEAVKKETDISVEKIDLADSADKDAKDKKSKVSLDDLDKKLDELLTEEII